MGQNAALSKPTWHQTDRLDMKVTTFNTGQMWRDARDTSMLTNPANSQLWADIEKWKLFSCPFTMAPLEGATQLTHSNHILVEEELNDY